jgi:hypothetical protein
MRVLFDGGLLENKMGAKKTAEVISLLLRALVESNLDYLAQYPDTPHPYRAGIRYKREDVGEERWKSIPKVIEDGEGDCEDLATYLAAYLVHKGVRPVSIVVRWYLRPMGKRLYHILVRGPRGYEDPSRQLGM